MPHAPETNENEEEGAEDREDEPNERSLHFRKLAFRLSQSFAFRQVRIVRKRWS